MKNKILKSWLVAQSFMPFLALGQRSRFNLNLFGGGNSGLVRSSSTYGLCYVLNIFDRVISWGQAILFITAVLMVLWAAWMYVTSATGKGAAENTKTAKDTLIYAAVGVGVALLAYAVVPVVSSLVGVSYYEQC